MAESRLADLTIDPSIESPAIWRVLADSPLAIYLAGPDGVLRHASRRAANLLGSTSESELLNAGANIFNWRTTAEDRAAFNAMLDAGPSARAQQAV